MSHSSSESNIFNRRYELPTCSLEVWTERSPLSEWQSQIVAQNLRFRLQLANGRSRNQKVIKGNQQQITNLIETVTTYCDRWLAQDDFATLDHAIEIPKLSKLKLSTLQLFDLYESLELCANEFVILPNLVIEVHGFNLNWLKVIAGAIALVGISIGAIRLIYPDTQPSYQIASTPLAPSSEQAVVPPSVNSDKSDKKLDPTENAAKITEPSKSPNSIISSVPPNTSQEINREAKVRERSDKTAIDSSPSNSSSDNFNSDRQRASANSPSINDGIKSPPRRLETLNKDIPQSSTAEASKPAPASPKLSAPSAIARSPNADIAITNIQVLQIQSELPSDVTEDLVRYLQAQKLSKSSTGILIFDLEISGDRIINILFDNQSSTLKDNKAIAEVEKLISQWRSLNTANGKLRLVLQM